MLKYLKYHFFKRKKLQGFRRCQNLTEFAKIHMPESLKIFIIFFFQKKAQGYFGIFDRIYWRVEIEIS